MWLSNSIIVPISAPFFYIANDMFKPLWDFRALKLQSKQSFLCSQNSEITHAPHDRLETIAIFQKASRFGIFKFK